MKETSMHQKLQQFKYQIKKLTEANFKLMKDWINMLSHSPFTLSPFAVIPPTFTTIPVGKQETEGGGNTAGQDIAIGAPHKRSGST